MRRGRETSWRISGGSAFVAVALAAAVPAGAQWDDRYGPTGPSAWLGISILGANPVGEFGTNVDDGFGLGVDARFPVSGTDGVLSLRLDGGFVVYGHESRNLCFPAPVGCRIGLDLDTYNTIGTVGIGPEFSVPGPISPYVNGSFGIAWFYTNSSISGDDDWEPDFNTVNHSDWVTALRVGGGMRFALGSGGRFKLDVGAQYHRNGVAEYLRKGDILDHPDGSITLFPQRTEANMVVFDVGVSIGLGGRPDGRGNQDDHPGHRRR